MSDAGCRCPHSWSSCKRTLAKQLGTVVRICYHEEFGIGLVVRRNAQSL